MFHLSSDTMKNAVDILYIVPWLNFHTFRSQSFEYENKHDDTYFQLIWSTRYIHI